MNNHEIFSATVAHYLAPIRNYLEDASITEVMINRFDEIFIESNGQLKRAPAQFKDEDAYQAAVNNILQFTGKSINSNQPLIDTRLPDGSRVHVAMAPCARFGTAVTIRKFNKDTLDIKKLMELGSISRQSREYLNVAIKAERNILVAGGTSSGKTSLLNALSADIPPGARIVVIEDSAELQLQQDHVISLEARRADRYGRGEVSIRELFRSSLRLRPDRIIIGEVRGGEALDMIQAMTSGHGGSMGTLHANNPADALNRLETMALMSKVELPLHALRAQVSSAIDVVVQTSRHIGGQRLVSQISEIDPIGADGRYQLRDIFAMRPVVDKKGRKGMQLRHTGVRSAMAGLLRGSAARVVTELTKEMFTPAQETPTEGA
ncbi:MAG TPA: tight adherence protein [Phycisphaerales bacterium]|nr:tight adherence protein [Phycisphaerales bacterium]HCD34197.1 tight adherence protein [Phycisphaerales bacterium]|tara:strand:- start:563 stop:1696 length:1134 start_codon:yes stop_codon:yes gene_type:complete